MYSELSLYNISNGKKQLNEIDGEMKTTGWGGRSVLRGAELDLTACLSLFAYLLEAQMSALSSLWTPH